jgi:pyrroline-5-carboxylate reductase
MLPLVQVVPEMNLNLDPESGLIGAGGGDLIIVSMDEINEEIATSASERLGIEVFTNNKKLAKMSDIIFIATKPNYVESVLQEISSEITCDKLVVSIAAGVKTEKIEKNLPQNTRVIRVMPNTPALVLAGMSAVTKGSCATDYDAQFVVEFLEKIGKCIIVDESQIDIVTAISGSGPAFYYKVINEIARAGEKLGMDYEKALLLSIQTAIGSARMMISSDKTPEELVASVATKGGCTEVGVNYMNEADTANLFYNLIDKTTIKARELGQ